MGTALLMLVIAALGAVLNRFRGGGIILLPGETVVPDHKRTQVRRLTYCAYTSLAAWNPFVGVGIFAWLLTGWGFPVSAAVGRNSVPWQAEFWLLDQLTILLVGKANARLYGTVWLTLFGLCTAATVIFLNTAWASYHSGVFTFPLASLWLLGWGVMGLCYRIATDIELGEIYYGAAQSFIISLFLTTTL